MASYSLPARCMEGHTLHTSYINAATQRGLSVHLTFQYINVIGKTTLKDIEHKPGFKGVRPFFTLPQWIPPTSVELSSQ